MEEWLDSAFKRRIDSILMKKKCVLAVLMCGIVAAACAEKPDPAGPGELVRAWVEMWNSYDLHQVKTLFLNDPGLSYFSSEREGVIRGMEALLEHHRGFGFVPGGSPRTSRLWVEGLAIDLFGETAVLTAIWHFERGGVDVVEPEPPQRGPVTFVCVHRQGRWWFVHMNFGNYPSAI
jgi:hypothetical protein